MGSLDLNLDFDDREGLHRYFGWWYLLNLPQQLCNGKNNLI